ncbi:hypothetical protein EJB05_48022 [Eragrostis curvula]|uniref:Serine protease n=1 Tax=Eragrostis curvula TaxID=38414 RepID=A0A5J9T0T4_9POAL|nr:hypothetical protein EJB05_48022 [Eragrostis curvula]
MASSPASRWGDTILRMYEPAMVRLHVRGRFKGNGFVVHSDGGVKLIMTCQHVVEGLPVNAVVTAYFSESCGGKTNARLLFADVDRDLALLRADGVHRQIQPVLFTDEPARLGNEILLLTFFDMDGAMVVRPGTFPGEITEAPFIFSLEPNLVETIVGNYTAKKGSSGAPVIAVPSLQAIGVNIRGQIGMKGAVSVRTILEALRSRIADAEENATVAELLELIAG